MDHDPSRAAAMEMEAARESRKRSLEAIAAGLVESGYTRPGESVTVNAFETPATKKLKASGEWPEGNYKQVARLDSVALLTIPEVDQRKPRRDALNEALVAAGYRVSVCLDWENTTDTQAVTEYYLYEKE